MGFAHRALNCRTVDEIQRNVIKRGERNAISRRFHAKDDKKAIAAWRLDFDRTLHVFIVRSVTSVWSPLNFRFQLELGTNAHSTTDRTATRPATGQTITRPATGQTITRPATGQTITRPSTRHGTDQTAVVDFLTVETIAPDVPDVSKTHPTFSVSRNDVENTHTIVSDISRSEVKAREDAGDRNQVVSTIRTLTVIEQPHQIHAYCRLDSRHVSNLDYLFPCVALHVSFSFGIDPYTAHY